MIYIYIVYKRYFTKLDVSMIFFVCISFFFQKNTFLDGPKIHHQQAPRRQKSRDPWGWNGMTRFADLRPKVDIFSWRISVKLETKLGW